MIEHKISITYKSFDIDGFSKKNINCDLDYFNSQIIESIILDFPIQTVICTSDENDIRTVVCGGEIISTIKNYMSGCFELVNLELLSEYNGMRLSDLPYNIQRRLGDFLIKFCIINPSTDKNAIDSIINRNK